MTPFQIVIIGIFVAFIVAGVFVFAVFGGLTGGGDIGAVTIWGTIDSRVMEDRLGEMTTADRTYEQVRYEEKRPETYKAELLEALAAGRAPDLIFLPQDEIVSFADKVTPIPYESLSERRFTDSFIPEGGLYLGDAGIWGLPLTIDPLVMYVNRDLFASAGVAQVPRNWDEFFTFAPKITSLDTTSNVRRSAVALGSYDNIGNAKEILSALFMQAGEGIIVRSQGGVSVTLGSEDSSVGAPAESALRFYTEFSNPAKSVYSWNRALPEARNAFIAGDVAVYFGFASEYPELVRRNPNLAIEVAPIPQVRDGKTSFTFGNMQALALTRTTQNQSGALIVASVLSGPEQAGKLAAALGLPPVRRDLLQDTPGDAVASVFAESALMARGWLDPEPEGSEAVFKAMIESVVSGRLQLPDAIRDGAASLNELMR